MYSFIAKLYFYSKIPLILSRYKLHVMLLSIITRLTDNLLNIINCHMEALKNNGKKPVQRRIRCSHHERLRIFIRSFFKISSFSKESNL